MVRRDRRRLLAGLGAALLGGCTAGPREIVEGGRRAPAEGGIGGTGIVGVVTALGSIRVNGLEVALPDAVEIADALGPRPRAALRPGVSVTVEATGPLGALEARRVRIDHPLIGRVERLARDGREMRVLGVAVRLEPGVNAPVEKGDRVAVSGLWRRGAVVASRIDRLGADGPSAVAGEIGTARGRPAVGGVPLVRAGGVEAPEPGSFATAVGEAREGLLILRRLEPGRFTGAAGPLARLSVEGYLEPVPRAPGWALSGLGHSFDEAARLEPLAETRALFAGPYTGDFAVAAALPLPEGPRLRERMLSVAAPLPLAERDGAVGTR
jgi:hypothetical protein